MVFLLSTKKPHSVRTLFVWVAQLSICIAIGGCVSQTVARDTQSDIVIPDVNRIKPVVAFAGITFQGGPAERQNLFRYSAPLVEEQKLSIALFRKLQQQQPQNFDISPRKLTKRNGSTYALSLMLDGEYVSVEQMAIDADKGYKLSLFISAQAVLFDVEHAQYVLALPLEPINHISFQTHPPTDADIRSEMLEALNSNLANEINLLDNFVRRVLSAPAPNRASLVQLAVTNVDIEQKADWALPEQFKDKQYALLKRFVAQQLIKNLAINQQVAIQPFVIDGSVLKMQSRFSGEDITYSLTLPKPAYSIDFTLRGLKKVEHDKNKAGQVFIYASFSNLLVKQQSGSPKTLLNLQLKNGAVKQVPASMTKVDDWAAFNESIMALLANISTDLHQPGSSFYKAQNFDKAAKGQISALQGVYQQCQI